MLIIYLGVELQGQLFMRIKNRVIETEFLLKANPEEVYRYLLDDKNKDLRYTEFVLSELIKRKEKLIDLAIAQVATDENIFKKLYAYNDRALRIAILENNRHLFGHVNPFSDQILRKSWLTKDQFLQILKDQNFVHEKVALFSNSSFNLFSLEDVYNKDHYSKKELKDFVENLNAQQFAKIAEFYKSLPQLIHEVKFNCIKCEKPNTVELRGLASFFTQASRTRVWLTITEQTLH